MCPQHHLQSGSLNTHLLSNFCEYACGVRNTFCSATRESEKKLDWETTESTAFNHIGQALYYIVFPPALRNNDLWSFAQWTS